MHQCGKITPGKSPCLGEAKVAHIVLVCVIIFPSYFFKRLCQVISSQTVALLVKSR